MMNVFDFFYLHYTAYRPELEQLTLTHLNDAQVRARPLVGGHSLAWLLWHTARSEDFYVNTLLAGRRSVFAEGGWGERLGLPPDRLQHFLSDQEPPRFGDGLDLGALRAYWYLVGQRTEAVIDDLRPQDLDPVYGAARVGEALTAAAALPVASDAFAATVAHCGERPRGWYLSHILVHAYGHIREARLVRTLVTTGQVLHGGHSAPRGGGGDQGNGGDRGTLAHA